MTGESLSTGRDGKLLGRLWTPSIDEPLGTVIVVHGLGDHAGRYESFARSVTQAGWSVFAFDLPGHGRSPGSPGRIDSYDSVMADIAAARMTISNRYPGNRQVLLGHSMGGNLALNYLLRRSTFDSAAPPLSGLALCAPMLLPPTPMQRSWITAAWLTGYLMPWLRINRVVDTDCLTRDPHEARAIKEDPMIHSKISIYLATQLVAQGRWALDHARDVDVQTLVMFGEKDSLIDRNACEHLSIRIGKMATLVQWPDTHHALFHDTNRETVIERLKDWLTGI